jgi:hypothetical protein
MLPSRTRGFSEAKAVHRFFFNLPREKPMAWQPGETVLPAPGSRKI